MQFIIGLLSHEEHMLTFTHKITNCVSELIAHHNRSVTTDVAKTNYHLTT